MTLDDLDIWWLLYSQFVDADSESDIHFALNIDPDAQDSYTFGIITAESTHRNGMRDPA